VNTVVVSDMHVSEAHDPEPRRPLWMAYKQRRFFIDADFEAFLEHLHLEAPGDEPLELVLNGDIFDFDAVTRLPKEPEGRIDWLARLRGLGSEEWMSRFKMETIVADHPVWFGALRRFLERGHRVVFVIGNHDVELNWPAVQRIVRDAIGVANDDDRVRFCSWFYLSNEDTYISHGHQYDPNCALENPIDPLIEVHGRPRVRIPFGDMAGRYMLNGMGYFNPHATENYIMSGTQYAKFFLRYMLLTQPLLLWTWFWSAVATLFVSLRDHWRPPMRDPLLVEEKVAAIARRSNATPSTVRRLAALTEPSSCTNPFAVMRELWLDRGFLFLGLMFLAWQLVLHVNIAWPVSPLWALGALALFIPPWLVYTASIKSTVFAKPLLDEQRAEIIHRITGARNVVFGHSHAPVDQQVGPVRYLNGGFFSPAFAEPECKNRIGAQTFVWIRPTPEGERAARLYAWPIGAEAPVPFAIPEKKKRSRRLRARRASERPLSVAPEPPHAR
jgi:UDP-2,3-diacylglucosamine pyrophosphatase LpxH